MVATNWQTLIKSLSKTQPTTCKDCGLPQSIAIAGIYGYIGKLIYNAALELGIEKVYGFDPGTMPSDFVTSDRLELLENAQDFYDLDADLFHIATHPDVREGVYRLIERDRHITIEKPIAHPSQPAECLRLKHAVKASRASVYFDFVEVFNPRTFHILEILTDFAQHHDFRISSIYCERVKDREDPLNPRNRKVIVPIQYQETSHCLALLLYVLNRGTSFDTVFPTGITVKGVSESYNPPNPEDYKCGVVDGKVEATITCNDLVIVLHTNFKKKGARPSKRFAVQGQAAGQSFCIEAVYDGFKEYLIVNGVPIATPGEQNRHKNIVTLSWSLHQQPGNALCPDVDFAWLVFGLSAALWESCFLGKAIKIRSTADLIEAMHSYPCSLPFLTEYKPNTPSILTDVKRAV